MIDGENFFDHPIKSNVRTYDNIQKIVVCWIKIISIKTIK